MSHDTADAETTIAVIGLTAATFEELRTRSQARTAEPGRATQDDHDVAMLIDDRDGLVFELYHEAIRVNALVDRLRTEGNEPDLPYTELPADVVVSAHAAELPEMMRPEEFHEILRRDVACEGVLTRTGMNQTMLDRTILVTARAPLAARMLYAKARFHALQEWVSRLSAPVQQ